MVHQVELKVSNWINQFDSSERYYIRNILNELEFISKKEFENSIETLLLTLYNKNCKRIALFQVLELCDEYKHIACKDIPKFARREAGSSKSIALLISQLQKQYPRYFISNPSIKCLKSEKIKYLIFIDDIIGSGQRIIDFWNYFVPRTIKSWLSYGKCNIYFLSYAKMNKGVKNIVSLCKGIKRDEFIAVKNNPSFTDKKIISSLCEKYLPSTSEKNLCGYGSTFSNVVFEGKCSNNLPPFLWAEHCRIEPLFKKRFVSEDIFSFFYEKKQYKVIEQVWSAGQLKLAYSLLDNFNLFREKELNLLCFLAMVNKGLSYEKIQRKMDLKDNEFSQVIAKATNCHAVEYRKITEFGLCLLENYKIQYRKNAHKNNLHVCEDNLIYIPMHYRGISFV